MKAHARVVVERRRERSRCTTLRSEPPLTFRSTPDGLHLVGTSAGPVGGDELALDVVLAAGTELTVHSVAAQLVLPSPVPVPSTMRVRVRVGEGASLRWLPEPTLVVRGADHRVTVTIDLAQDADLVWRDEAVLGRNGEPGGSLLQTLRVERRGRPLLCTEVALGPAWPASGGPAGTGGARVAAATLLAGRPARAALAHRGGTPTIGSRGVRGAAYLLADDAVLLTALGNRLDEVRSTLGLCTGPSSGLSGDGRPAGEGMVACAT